MTPQPPPRLGVRVQIRHHGRRPGGPQPQFHAMEETFDLPPDTTPGYGGEKGTATIRDWVAMARGETPACRNTIDSTLTTLRLLDAVYASSEGGRRVECGR